MAVVSVWGDVNGHEVVCTYTGNDQWTADAPSDCPDGYYVCEFWAEDDAGNIAYRTAMLWVVDGRLVCIQWIDDDIQVEYQADNLNIEFVDDILAVEPLDILYSAMHLSDPIECHFINITGCQA